jgi:hypothetical protein
MDRRTKQHSKSKPSAATETAATRTHRVETYEPKRRTEEENRMLIRAAVNKASEDTSGRALRPDR